MTLRKRLLAIMAMVLVALSTAVVPASAAPAEPEPAPPASIAAATPQCYRDLAVLPDGPQPALVVPAAGATWSSTYCWMARGNVSGGVWALQRTLHHCYGSRVGEWVSIDGDFGGQTERVLRRVQGLIGARVDGVYGPETRNRMEHASLHHPSSCWRLGSVGWP